MILLSRVYVYINDMPRKTKIHLAKELTKMKIDFPDDASASDMRVLYKNEIQKREKAELKATKQAYFAKTKTIEVPQAQPVGRKIPAKSRSSSVPRTTKTTKKKPKKKTKKTVSAGSQTRDLPPLTYEEEDEDEIVPPTQQQQQQQQYSTVPSVDTHASLLKEVEMH